MGESVKSFSNPADISHKAKEGDPIRALTESVSFGRFMSESLAWEKWSTFSNNRYLEEVEKFSEPGSVAQKKAYFEAHYKRRAAMRAAALLEQANTVINGASQMGTINAALAVSSLNTDSANADTSLAMNQQDNGVSDVAVANTADVDAGNLNVERDNMDVTDAEGGQAVMEQNVTIENNTQIENSKALENIENHGMIMATPHKKMPHNECTDQKNSTSSSNKRPTSSLSKSSKPIRASQLPLNPSKIVASAQARSDTDVAKFAGNSNDKMNTIPNSLHKSITVTSGASKTTKTSLRMPKDSPTSLQTPTSTLKKAADQENLAPSSDKRQSNSMLKLSNHGRASKRAPSRIANNHALINKTSAVDSTEQRRIVQKSLHMSMNFTMRTGETNKTSPKISRESLTPLQTPTRASVNGGPKLASKVPLSQDRRTRAAPNKSVSGGVTGDGRWPTLSNCSKSSTASGTSRRSAISSSPFSFRSEERAAKRKEFFKKLADKMNSKEVEKSQMQIRSKITSTWPQSPNFGRKPPPSTVQDANSRPPRRPSIDPESSKHVLRKNNRMACSMTSLPKNRHENASPNIQPSVGK
ncbi:protein WVD2-like 7 isoform X2 [Durio zibethinus]|uniref:Protein WVD2-like 7 isoform X2 n=1 Tax=Durio zibethinus TaxID=66656 RepID=A0A6P5Y3F1_DURZI|nr:protein WVD2-like 7 isoform X2 [Durio zibethinus]